MPFFSVVVPVFNRVEFIVETIDSILLQRFNDFEVIIIDDGSTDNTSGILAESFRDNKKIRIIRQENKERGAARNNGFKNATGEYVVFFDSDDLMHDDHLETLHQKILEHNFPEFLATKFHMKKGNKIRNSDCHRLEEGYYDYHLFLNGNPLACNVCVKRNNSGLKLFEEDRKFAIMEDWMFFLQNLRHHKLYLIDKVTITMNDHENRSMQSEHNLIIQKTFWAFDRIKNKIELNADDVRQLEAHVNYFCGIHSYAAYHRKPAIQYIRSAVSLNGLKKKYAVLLLKTIIGRRLLSKFHS